MSTWLIQKTVFSFHSVGLGGLCWLADSVSSTCLFSLGKATKLHNVFLSSASGSSVASLRFSRLILSSRLFSQQNKTAIWKVVTSKSNLPALQMV